MIDDSIFPVSEDPRSKAILEIARRAAQSNATVLINGETGVGKELLARFIHQQSHYANGPFISVNCAALPENMIEAILFGYEKGAFTGATSTYIGKFEQADQGTLLLDEISEVPLSLQAKLLRVLQEREVERLCGKRMIPINVRIIAATNRDLQQQIAVGLFRKDLFYRISVVPIYFASLRERHHDIIPLANYFIKLHALANSKQPPVLTPAAQKKLISYNWPGNIRELDNVIQRTLIMTDANYIDATDILLYEENQQNLPQLTSRLKVDEAKTIINVLNEADGHRTVAAQKLNMSPRTLRYKISKLKSIGLKVPQKI